MGVIRTVGPHTTVSWLLSMLSHPYWEQDSIIAKLARWTETQTQMAALNTVKTRTTIGRDMVNAFDPLLGTRPNLSQARQSHRNSPRL